MATPPEHLGALTMTTLATLAAVLMMPTSTTHHPCGISVGDLTHGDLTTCPDCLGLLTLYQRRADERHRHQGTRYTVCPACGDTISPWSMKTLAKEPNGSQTVVCSPTCKTLWEE